MKEGDTVKVDRNDKRTEGWAQGIVKTVVGPYVKIVLGLKKEVVLRVDEVEAWNREGGLK